MDALPADRDWSGLFRRAILCIWLLYGGLISYLVLMAFDKDGRYGEPARPVESITMTSGFDAGMTFGAIPDLPALKAMLADGQIANHAGAPFVQPMSYLRDGMLWMRFDMPEITTPDGQVVLSLADSRVRVARLIIDGGDLPTIRDWRIDDDDHRIGLGSRTVAFMLTKEELAGRSVWIGYKSLSALRTLVNIESRRAYENSSLRKTAWVVFLSGIVFTVGFGVLGLWLVFRHTSLLLIALLAATTFTTLFGGGGLFHGFVFVEHPNLADFFAYIPKPLSIGLWLLLAMRTNPSIRPPFRLAVHAVIFLAALQPVTFALKLWLGWPVPAVATSAWPTLMMLATGMLIIAWEIVRRRNRLAVLFALAWSPVVLGMLVRSLVILWPTPALLVGLAADPLLDIVLSITLLALMAVVNIQRDSLAARMKAEVAEERFRSFAEIGSEGFFEIDRQGRCLTANGQLSKMIGLESGMPLKESLAERLDADAVGSILAVLNGLPPNEKTSVEFSMRDGSGIRWLSLSAQSITDSGTAHFRGTISDMTASVLQRERAGHVNTMMALGEMAAGLAHEVNNLIHPIVNLVRRIRDRHVGDTEGVRLADLVLKSGERAGVIVANVLAQTRAGARSGPPISLTLAVQAALDTIETSVPGNIRLHRDIAPVSGIEIDGGEMVQVLANLFANAVRAIDGNGEISVTLHQENHAILLLVTDTGKGIATTITPDIIRAFGPSQTSTGLGLSIIHDLVKRWGGTFILEPNPVKGTRAVIRFDRAG